MALMVHVPNFIGIHLQENCNCLHLHFISECILCEELLVCVTSEVRGAIPSNLVC